MRRFRATDLTAPPEAAHPEFPGENLMRTVLATVPVCTALSVAVYAQEAAPRPAEDDRTDALFQVGMIALQVAAVTENADERRKLYDDAIESSRAILVNRPELMRVSLELARTFFLKEQDELARRHFELVLAAGPPVPVALNIQRFLAVMRARKRWTGYFGAAIAPDSNLKTASESEVIYIDTAFGRLPFRREGDFGARSGFGLSMWGRGEYPRPLTERLRLRVGSAAVVSTARREVPFSAR